MGGNIPFFCKTPPPKLFHAFIVVNHPILREQKFRKISPETKVVVFPMFFIQLCCGMQPHHNNGKQHKTPTQPQHIYR